MHHAVPAVSNPVILVDEALQAALTYVREIANRQGLALNPNERRLEKLAEQLAQTKNEVGKYICPCKRSFPLQPDTDVACPCDSFLDDVKRLGHCDCSLFFEIGAAAQAKRRPGLLAAITCPG